MIYFIGGNKSREFKAGEIIAEIRKNGENLEEYYFDGELKEEEKFLDKINFNSIFSLSEQLIVLKRAEKIKSIGEILNYICDLELINRAVIVNYEQEDGKMPAKLKKVLEKLQKEKENNFKMYWFSSFDEKELLSYVEKELNVKKAEAKHFLEMVGTDIFKVKNELDKVKSFLMGEAYDLKEVKKIISIEKDFEIYEITNNIFQGKISEVLEYLAKTKEYMGILYSLYGELEMMLKIVLLKEEGYQMSMNYNSFKTEFEEIKEAFKVNKRIANSYAVFKKMERLNKYSKKRLQKLVYRAWETEKDIKTGRVEMESAVESFILEVGK